MSMVTVTSLIRRKEDADVCSALLNALCTACANDAALSTAIQEVLSRATVKGVTQKYNSVDFFNMAFRISHGYSDVLGSYIDSAQVEFPG